MTATKVSAAKKKTRSVQSSGTEKKKPGTAPPPKPQAVEKAHDHVVVLVRHGIAEDRSVGIPDANRSLTDEGHAEMKKIARGLAVIFPKTDAIMSSPLLRAVETALRVGRRYKGYSAVETTNALLPEADPAATIELIRSIAGQRAILVGHEPHLSATLAALTGVLIDFQKGGCACVRIPADGRAQLEWIASPKLLVKVGG